jgi:hypothetical protein
MVTHKCFFGAKLLGHLGDPKNRAPNHTKVVFGEKWGQSCQIWRKTVLRTKVTKLSDLDMVWFILISSWVCSKLFFCFERAVFIGPLAILLEHWTLSNGSTSLDPSSKIGTNVFPNSLTFQVICMRVELWRKAKRKKLQKLITSS